jgi:N-acetylmuramoyl-L-alanine amidase
LRQQGLENPQKALPVVIGLTLQENQGRARLTLEVSDPLDIKAFTLANPNRVVLDMPEVLWRMAGDARPSGKGAIKSYRYGLFRKGGSRFVIDLNHPVKVEPAQLLQPERGQSFRLVIDLGLSSTEAFASLAGWPEGGRPQTASLPPPASLAGSPLATTGKRVIIVDAGHGGSIPARMAAGYKRKRFSRVAKGFATLEAIAIIA